MCGRFILTSPIESIRQTFGVPANTAIPARYNIAPTQPILAVRLDEAGDRELAALEWGLVPSWAKQRQDKPLINARFETAAVKPSFKGSYKRRRCLVPANGWYEWKTQGGEKQPWLIDHAGGSLIAFAGLWDTWHGPDGENWLETVAILTSAAMGPLKKIHHRRPLILDTAEFADWLAPHDPLPRGFDTRFHWLPETAFTWRQVSKRVGNVRFDDASLLDPPEDTLQGTLL